MKKYIPVTAIALLLGSTLPSLAQVTVITSADTYLSNDGSTGSTTNHGIEEIMELRMQLGVNNQRSHIAYFQFDLSSVTGDFTGATLTLNVTNSTRSNNISFYGVVDGAVGGQGEAWNETTVSYSDAAGFAPAAPGTYATTSELTAALATINIPVSSTGDFTTVPNASMDAYMAADTNDLVTFAAIYPGPDGNALYWFSTLENKTSGAELAARLYLPNATAVPEPATYAALLGGLVFLLVCLRRRQR